MFDPLVILVCRDTPVLIGSCYSVFDVYDFASVASSDDRLLCDDHLYISQTH